MFWLLQLKKKFITTGDDLFYLPQFGITDNIFFYIVINQIVGIWNICMNKIKKYFNVFSKI